MARPCAVNDWRTDMLPDPEDDESEYTPYELRNLAVTVSPSPEVFAAHTHPGPLWMTIMGTGRLYAGRYANPNACDPLAISDWIKFQCRGTEMFSLPTDVATMRPPWVDEAIVRRSLVDLHGQPVEPFNDGTFKAWHVAHLRNLVQGFQSPLNMLSDGFMVYNIGRDDPNGISVHCTSYPPLEYFCTNDYRCDYHKLCLLQLRVAPWLHHRRMASATSGHYVLRSDQSLASCGEQCPHAEITAVWCPSKWVHPFVKYA